MQRPSAAIFGPGRWPARLGRCASRVETDWGYPATPQLPFVLPLALSGLQPALAYALPKSLNEPLGTDARER